MGAYLDGFDHAVIWADSEIFCGRAGAPHAHEAKLFINALATAVGCGSGQSSILRDADEAVMQAASYDDVPERVKRALRVAVGRHGSTFDREPFGTHATYLTVGWSPSAGRMLAHEYTIGNFFSPLLTPLHFSPEVGRSEFWRPKSEAEFFRMAKDQVDVIRQTCPGSGSGTLTVADLRPGYITARAYPGFAVPCSSIEQGDMSCLSMAS